MEIPNGMIFRTKYIDWGSAGKRWYALVGWPTPKGNFSNKTGKWPATGDTEREAIALALSRASKQPLSRG